MLRRASAVEFREAREEMWPDVTLRQLELIVVFDLHPVQAKRVRRHATGTTDAAFEHFLDSFPPPPTATQCHQHPRDLPQHDNEKHSCTGKVGPDGVDLGGARS